jgi:hypothetical protein
MEQLISKTVRCPYCSRVYTNANPKKFDKLRCGDCEKVFDI